MLKKLKLRQKYNESIAFRYLSIASICLAVLQLTFGASQSYRIYQQKANNLAEKADAKLSIINTVVQSSILRSDPETLGYILQANNKDSDIIYGIVLNQNSKVISQVIAKDKPIVNELIKENKLTEDNNILSALKSHKSIVELSRPIKIGEYHGGHIKIGYSLEAANKELIKSSFYNIYSSVLISVFFIVLTIVIFNKQILNPIQKLQQLAEAVASGKLDSKVDIGGKDELATLSSALNTMTLQIKHTLNDLEKAIDNALIAEKAKTKFIAKMSHELRTPLNGIIGFTQIMQQEFTNKEQQDNLAVIEKNSLHLLDLINSILEVSHIESGKTYVNLKPFNLYEILKSIEQMFTFKAKQKQIKLSFKIDKKVPQFIESDAEKLRQILFNLLDNSIKFTDTGKVTLTVKYKSDEHNDFLYNLYFKVDDTGRGISSSEIDNLFVAFAQTDTGERSGQGMGLGLPMTRQLVQLMGGDVSIKSEVNQGTVVRFFIPVREADMSKISLQGFYDTDSQSLEGDSLESQFFYQPSSSYDLAQEILNSMPQEWLLQLQDATTKVDNEIILELLKEIPEDYQVLHQSISDLIDNFRYDSILELVEEALNK
ncbi:MAG: ATP-binding protein [Xenococcaceae cyanobacterium MO_188.B19]|nr:ATP-binding protein [Xenococcaceae cyanobacterium MO_188.B19]